MLMRDLHELPKFRDGLSYLYIEHAKIEQDHLSIAVFDADGKIPVPCANLALLMLGPGTSITHAAIKALADNGCLVVWSGEEGLRFYASGMGKTRSARNILVQAQLVSNPAFRLQVVKNMYSKRFKEALDSNFTIQQLRGREGARVRKAYSQASKETGVEWHGRKYKRSEWSSNDPINIALSTANACLYGICHSAIIATGYSPALGFIHTGKQLSFVYDIADLYKTEVSIPLAFQIVKESLKDVSRRVRFSCRDTFREWNLLKRIIPDIQDVLSKNIDTVKCGEDQSDEFARDGALPGGLWDPSSDTVQGGRNFGSKEEE